MKETQGRTALVTGASQGIGAAIARANAHRGMRVAVHYNSSRAAAEEVRESLPGKCEAQKRTKCESIVRSLLRKEHLTPRPPSLNHSFLVGKGVTV